MEFMSKANLININLFMICSTNRKNTLRLKHDKTPPFLFFLDSITSQLSEFSLTGRLVHLTNLLN